MPGQRRAIGDHVAAHWTRRTKGAVGLGILAALTAAGTAAFILLTGGTPGPSPRPLSTTLSASQLTGLAIPGPTAGSLLGLLAPSGRALAFQPPGNGGSVQPYQQWQADRMTDDSYIIVYVPDGRCLSASGSRQSGRLSLATCDLQLAQRWSHPYLGKDSAGRDYWQLRSSATGLCLAAAGTQWTAGTPGQLVPCGSSRPWQQLIQFSPAY